MWRSADEKWPSCVEMSRPGACVCVCERAHKKNITTRKKRIRTRREEGDKMKNGAKYKNKDENRKKWKIENYLNLNNNNNSRNKKGKR